MDYLKNTRTIITSSIQKNSMIVLGFLVSFAVLILINTIPLLAPPTLQVSFLDIGQGDAIWIQAPNGRELLIDSGPDQSIIDRLGETKSFFDRTIDMILATHSDADHIGGFPYVLDRYKIGTVIESEISSPTLIDRTFGQKVASEHANTLTARNGERIILDPKYGVVIDVLFPDQNPNGWETNEASIVVKVSYGDTSFLLTGDSPSDVEDYLVKTYGEQLKSDVLKLGHHGSKTSSSDVFLQAVHPTTAIVSAGLGNKYGHPAPEVIERVESINAQILETSQLGTIDCRSDGATIICSGSK
ncbi:MAG TPA: ComEC/Rec2 family competence protein [Candidatus Paceibacterota bacterium]|nr:ComEC/Rec2 family competence protein [Candidatus Paceibacterota bacterium]